MKNTLCSYIQKFNEVKIMVIGDMVADVYLEGKVSRISREAPVLILEYADETVVPGGASNVVNNAASLTAKVSAVGVIGDDSAGSKLKEELMKKSVDTQGLIIDENRPTITKTRIMAGGQATVRQQVVRIDKEKKAPLTAEVEENVFNYIMKKIECMDAVVLSDYGSHTVSPKIMRKVIDACNKSHIPCVVDSRYNVFAFKGVTVVKQNESEAAAAVGFKIVDEKTLLEAGRIILENLEAQAVLISRGPDGMSLFEKTGMVTHIPVSNKSEVYDVTGAGDTVVAAMILALAAGASYVDAARLSNYAAGVVVRKLGTATTTPEELRKAIIN